MEDDKCDLDEYIFDMHRLSAIRKRPDVLEKIRWNVTPEMVMEPRFQSKPEDMEKLKEMSGYIFYIETQCTPAALMLMKVGENDVMSTVGMIEEVPAELIRRAIDNPPVKPVQGMYAISDEIREWLKKELGG